MSFIIPLAETFYIVQIIINSAVILSILLARCVCREKPRFHVYLLLLANLFGIIYSAVWLHEYSFQGNSSAQYNAIDQNTATAAMIFTNLASNFAFLVGFFALQQVTKTYLGGTQLWIKVASALASLWTLAVLILSGVASSNLSVWNLLMIISIIGWGMVALCALLLLVLVGVRIFYNNRVPSGIARHQVVLTFALVAVYICLLTVDVIFSTVAPYVNDTGSMAVAGLIVDIIFFRAPGFLFAVFYRRLSAMPPYAEQMDVECADVQPLKA
ncbi:hypothetical protein INT43_000858 [Umbelopsis isabellina]|uniref:Uncharacterized protein n=1 Tax=Mortierella isabellina TaxID=91625 RepID=A0A8H7Q3N3_MORIS|nr:hypothetical protein INT43_000858 [Umbelopsis isabellina]